MKRPTKPLKELSDRELLEWTAQMQTHNENHLNIIKTWVQIFGWLAILLFIVGAIIAISDSVLMQ